jgi:membrane protease YdiL (CAAX protease family)
MEQPPEANLPEAGSEPRQQHISPTLAPGSLFVDVDGVRPIWRLLIYVALYYVLRFVLLSIAITALPGRTDSVSLLWFQLLEECLLLVAALLPALFLSKLEGHRFGTYGLPAHGAFGKQFWLGLVWGLVAITLLLLVMRGVGVFRFGHLALHGLRVLKFAAFWGAVFLVVGLYEDFLFRGYSLFTLAEAIGFWPAAILLSFAFGFIHLGNSGESWVGALGAACIGLFFCLTLRRTGTLWFAIGMHASWDWGESFLYSVPDSGQVATGHLLSSSFHGARWLTGGSVGPEGSVFVFVVIALLWVAFDRVYPSPKPRPDALATATSASAYHE